MTAIGYTSETEEIVKASWSLIHHDCAAAFQSSEKSPVPAAFSPKDLSAGRTQILNVRRIKPIDRHPAETDEDISPESILDVKNWHNWNRDLDNPNGSEYQWEADNESDMKLDNGSGESETPKLRIVSTASNVSGLIRPMRQWKNKIE